MTAFWIGAIGSERPPLGRKQSFADHQCRRLYNVHPQKMRPQNPNQRLGHDVNVAPSTRTVDPALEGRHKDRGGSRTTDLPGEDEMFGDKLNYERSQPGQSDSSIDFVVRHTAFNPVSSETSLLSHSASW